MTALNTYKIRWDSGPTIVNFNFLACVHPPPPLGKNRGERRLCFTVDNRVQR